MAPSDGAAVVILTLAGKGALEDAANGLLQQYNLTLVESKKESINGLNSILLVADQTQEQGTIRLVAGLIQHDGIVYNLMGITSLSRFPNYQSTFLSTIRDFRQLTDSEKLNRKPDVIRIKAVPQNMTAQAAFEHFGMPSTRMEELAIMNGIALNDRIEKGTLIKVVGK